MLVHDVYPEVAVAAKVLREKGWLSRLIAWQTRLLYRRVHRIIVLGRDMAELVARKGSLPPEKVTLIPNGADADSIQPQPRASNRLLHRLGLEHKFVIQYSGNMGRSHGIDCVLECAEQLRNETDIHFLLIGWGAKRAWLEEQIRATGLRNMTVIPPVPRSDLCESLNACDLAVIPFVSGMTGVSVPCRMYNVMAAGTPIIAVADFKSELAQVVAEEQIGVIVPPDDSQGLSRAIRSLRSNGELRRELSRKARRAAQTKYAWDTVLREYEEHFSQSDHPLNVSRERIAA